jgi:predicted amidohydrolase
VCGKAVTVAAASMRVEHDKRVNLRRHREFMDEASSKGVDLLAFPEVSLQGYTWGLDRSKCLYGVDSEQMEYFLRESEPIPGPSTNAIQEYCRRYDMVVQIGMAEKEFKRGRIKIYNSAVLIGVDGVIGVHRKVYMVPNPVFAAGDHFSVFRTKVGRLGPLICMDLVPPESVRDLAVQGAEVAVHSTAWGLVGEDPENDRNRDSYDVLTRANPIMDQIWLISSNQIGPAHEKGGRGMKGGYFGHSRVVTPVGKVVAEVGFEEGLAIAKIDVTRGIEEARSPRLHGSDFLSHRAPQFHPALAKRAS